MDRLKEERQEEKEVIKEKKKELDKLWLEVNFAVKKLKNYLDFYEEDKLLSDEELKDLKHQVRSLARMIKPSRRRTGRIRKIIEETKRHQRREKHLEEEIEEETWREKNGE